QSAPGATHRGDRSRDDQRQHGRRGGTQRNTGGASEDGSGEQGAKLTNPECRDALVVVRCGEIARLSETQREPVFAGRVETLPQRGGEAPDHRAEDASDGGSGIVGGRRTGRTDGGSEAPW